MEPNHPPQDPAPDGGPGQSHPFDEPPVQAELARRPMPAARPRKPGRLLPVLLVLVILALGGSVLVNLVLMAGAGSMDSSKRVQEKFYSHERYGSQKVVILSIDGVILGGDEGFVKRQIDRVAGDDDVKAVVLRVESPGGSVNGSDYLYHHLCEMREEKDIPLVVSMGDMAASGGYYVSMAVGDAPNTIFAEPTTWTGSIGVIVPHYDASELLQKHLGVKNDSIVSHPLKNSLSFTKTMSDDERKIWQELVDDSFDRFKMIVRSGRPKFEKDPTTLDKLATGQVYSADQALELGLVDKIGFLEDAVDRAIELSGAPRSEVRVVKYKPEPSLADVLMGGRAQASGFDLTALLELSVPRAYFLCTELPPLVESR